MFVHKFIKRKFWNKRVSNNSPKCNFKKIFSFQNIFFPFYKSMVVYLALPLFTVKANKILFDHQKIREYQQIFCPTKNMRWNPAAQKNSIIYRWAWGRDKEFLSLSLGSVWYWNSMEFGEHLVNLCKFLTKMTNSEPRRPPKFNTFSWSNFGATTTAWNSAVRFFWWIFCCFYWQI